MIYLITGQPGHGKTLYALRMARAFKNEGRAVYAAGVTQLDYQKAGFLKCEDPRAWADLPDNSVVLLDEFYEWYPNRNPASAVPPHVKAMATHRHRGFDFILVCQQVNQIDPFLRGLVDTHRHVRRKFGTKVAVVKTWDRAIDRPDKETGDSSEIFRQDPSLFHLYQSATMHTVKRKLPWWFFVAPPLLVFVLWSFWRLASGQTFASVEAHDASAAAATAKAGADASVGVRGRPHSEKDYIAWMTPRVEGIPWTAPAYDNLQPGPPPQLYCMSSQTSCRCITEQGTRVAIEAKLCRHIAINGIYNPFRSSPSADQPITK